MIDSYGLRLRLPLEGSEDKADGVLVYFLSDTDHQLGKKKKLRLNIPPGKYCTRAFKMQTLLLFFNQCTGCTGSGRPRLPPFFIRHYNSAFLLFRFVLVTERLEETIFLTT